MATESPIRMMFSRGKWSSLPGTETYTSSPVNVAVDEHGVLSRNQYQSGRWHTPNRSGSAPPSMEGSFAALENLMHSSYSASIYSSNVNDNLQHPARLASNQHLFDDDGTPSNSRRSSSFIDGCNNSLNLSWGVLPTHKEESEDDKSPQHAYNDCTNRSSLMWSARDFPSSVTRPRSLVDQTQEDFPCTPSLVSDQQHSLCLGSEEVADHNADSNSLPDQSIGVPNMVASVLHVDDVTSSQEVDFADPSASRSIPHDHSSMGSHLKSEAMASGASEIPSVESGIKALKICPPTNLDIHSSQEERQPIFQDSPVQHQLYQQNNILQFQSLMSQTVSQGMNNAYTDTNQISYLGKVSSADMQPVFQSSGPMPTLHAAPTAYLPSANPHYSGMQTPGVIYSPQYGLGGYGFNPMVFPPYLSGYPPHSAVPFNFNSASVPQYNPRASGVPSAGGSSNFIDSQSLSKFYGQHGITQHSFANPHVQLHPPYGDFYMSRVDPLALSTGFARSQGNAVLSQKRPDFSGVSSNHRPQNQGTGGTSNLNQRQGDVATPSYFRSSANMGVLQIPTSTLPNPVLPSSPISHTNLPYGRHELTFPHNSSTSASLYAGWTGQGGYESQNHTKMYSFLEELKCGKGRRLEISNVVGHVVEFSVDQHGSRFIQQKLENCSAEEKASVFKEVLPHASKLMTDVFGNYVIQKFFEYGTREQRKELANQLQGQILPLSLQMYGCRVIQKALEVIELEQKVELVRELDGHVLRCVRDQNGNHVIQKCIESIPMEKIDFIISAFRGQVATLSMHPYGCRVIQRVLEHCADGSQCQFIVDEILESVCTLAQNQYGNYVTQHVLVRGKSEERIQIIRKLAGQVVQMSQHKFASNVIEKCLEHGDVEGRELLIAEIIGINESNDNLLVMMKDQYANYVVQKILEMCTDSQRELLLGRIKVHLNALRKYTYGKHIVARFEQLFGQDIQASGS